MQSREIILAFLLFFGTLSNSTFGSISEDGSYCLTGDCMLCVLNNKPFGPYFEEFEELYKLKYSGKNGGRYTGDGITLTVVNGVIATMEIASVSFTDKAPYRFGEFTSVSEIIDMLGEEREASKIKKNTIIQWKLKDGLIVKALVSNKGVLKSMTYSMQSDKKWSYCGMTDEYITYEMYLDAHPKQDDQETTTAEASEFESIKANFPAGYMSCIAALERKDLSLKGKFIDSLRNTKGANFQLNAFIPTGAKNAVYSEWQMFGYDFHEVSFLMSESVFDRSIALEMFNYVIKETKKIIPNTAELKSSVEKTEGGWNGTPLTLIESTFGYPTNAGKGKYSSTKITISLIYNGSVWGAGNYDVKVEISYGETL